MKLTVLCDNIRSTLNVGAIFRTADALGCEKMYLSGITATPENPKVRKTALGAEKTVRWEHVWNASETLVRLSKKGYKIVSLEEAKGAVWYFDYKLPTKVCLVLGNEVDGVSRDVLKLSDAIVKIPMLKTKESLNVGTAFAVAGFDFLRRTRYGKK
jgi:tRNA G18 (ribose-2'-O)-methylase SpoU